MMPPKLFFSPDQVWTSNSKVSSTLPASSVMHILHFCYSCQQHQCFLSSPFITPQLVGCQHLSSRLIAAVCDLAPKERKILLLTAFFITAVSPRIWAVQSGGPPGETQWPHPAEWLPRHGDACKREWRWAKWDCQRKSISNSGLKTNKRLKRKVT